MTETLGLKINPKKQTILRNLKKQVGYCTKLTEDYKQKHDEIRRLVKYLEKILDETPNKKISDTDIASILSNLENLPDIDNEELIANQEDLRKKIEEQKKWKEYVDDTFIPSIKGKLPSGVEFPPSPSRNNLGNEKGIIAKVAESGNSMANTIKVTTSEKESEKTSSTKKKKNNTKTFKEIKKKISKS